MNDREIIDKLISISERNIEGWGKAKGQLELLGKDIADFEKNSDAVQQELRHLNETVTGMNSVMVSELTAIKTSLNSLESRDTGARNWIALGTAVLAILGTAATVIAKLVGWVK